MVTHAPPRPLTRSPSRYDRVNDWPGWPVVCALLANLWLLYLTLRETYP